MEKYKTSWKKWKEICEEYTVLCNRTPGQLKDKARNEKFRRNRNGIGIGVFDLATGTRDPSQGQ
ncbi:hypothetical protein C2G38_2125111 [Gigaspora rosea]|uniref:Uncharacterized protein n=1 Tax=Gigaspora rosea TaxID=44941 RepID=A0A397U0F2_9GLOM|nr:hypothetical protein C2G38_2125111 [Gigaspora rosea]